MMLDTFIGKLATLPSYVIREDCLCRGGQGINAG